MGCLDRLVAFVGVVSSKMGEIAHLLNTAEKGSSPLQIKLQDLGQMLGTASLLISMLVFVVGVITGAPAFAFFDSIFASLSCLCRSLCLSGSVWLSAWVYLLPICLSIYLPVCISLSPICLSIYCLPACLYLSLFLSVCVCSVLKF